MTNVVVTEVLGNLIATSEYVTSLVTATDSSIVVVSSNVSTGGGSGITWYTFNTLGSVCSGSTGALSRVLTLNNAALTTSNNFLVFREGAHVRSGLYSILHLSSSSQVTFSDLNVFDEDNLTVIYGY